MGNVKPQLMTQQELALLLGVTRQAVFNWASRSYLGFPLPAVHDRVHGKIVPLYSRDDVLAWAVEKDRVPAA